MRNSKVRKKINFAFYIGETEVKTIQNNTKIKDGKTKFSFPPFISLHSIKNSCFVWTFSLHNSIGYLPSDDMLN